MLKLHVFFMSPRRASLSLPHLGEYTPCLGEGKIACTARRAFPLAPPNLGDELLEGVKYYRVAAQASEPSRTRVGRRRR